MSRHTLNFVPHVEGDFNLVIYAGSVQDLATNPSIVSNTLVLTFDTTRPNATLTTTLTNNYTNVSPIPVTATFDEAVVGVVDGDWSVANGAASGTAGADAERTVDVIPTAQGLVTVQLPDNSVTDLAYNQLFASNVLTFVYDTVSPVVTLTSSAATLSPGLPIRTATYPLPVTATFDHEVVLFDAGDVT
eukprot:1191868-Pyramimonas_sp.AAC.1